MGMDTTPRAVSTLFSQGAKVHAAAEKPQKPDFLEAKAVIIMYLLVEREDIVSLRRTFVNKKTTQFIRIMHEVFVYSTQKAS